MRAELRRALRRSKSRASSKGKMKKQTIGLQLVAGVGLLAVVLAANGASDCGVSHEGGCSHRTISGDEACDTGAKDCSGADQATCNTTTGKHVEAFPKEVDDSTRFGGIDGKQVCWDGHHYITTDPNTHCSYTYACTWWAGGGSCVIKNNSQSGWSNASWKTSNQCN